MVFRKSIAIETSGHRDIHDITHLECDIKPRSREVVVTVAGDG